jgi:hypothetical protein
MAAPAKYASFAGVAFYGDYVDCRFADFDCVYSAGIPSLT